MMVQTFVLFRRGELVAAIRCGVDGVRRIRSIAAQLAESGGPGAYVEVTGLRDEFRVECPDFRTAVVDLKGARVQSFASRAV